MADERVEMAEQSNLRLIIYGGILVIVTALLCITHCATTTMSGAELCAKACGPGRFKKWTDENRTGQTTTNGYDVRIPASCECLSTETVK